MMLYFGLALCGLIISTVNGQSGSACVTPNGENARCVSIHSCSILSRLVTTGQQQDVRFLRQSQCGYFNGAPYVCCGTANGYRTGTQNTPRTPTGSGTFRSNPLLPDRGRCGFQEGANRVLGGVTTDLLEYPWMALLQYRKINGGYTFSCGGALINERYILTAAHCVTGAITEKVGTLVGVRLGEFDTSTERDCIPEGSTNPDQCNRNPIDIPVESAYAHQEYDDNSRSRYHDIALIRLEENVQFNEQIKPICLPLSSSERSRPGILSFAAGWGRTETANYSPKKLKVGLPIVANTDCARTFENAQVVVADTQMCAGGEEKHDSCNGDSGGPLMTLALNETDQWIAEGVVSFGTTCGTKYWPGIYTRVSEYLPWIHQNVRA